MPTYGSEMYALNILIIWKGECFNFGIQMLYNIFKKIYYTALLLSLLSNLLIIFFARN